jgi:ferredoxin
MTCISQVISGEVPERSQNVLLKWQKEKNLFLACVCWPKEDIEILLQNRKTGREPQ